MDAHARTRRHAQTHPYAHARTHHKQLCTAGQYVVGALNTASCPAQAYYIGSEAACRAAGTALSLAWGAAMTSATVPRWCSVTTTAVYFNAHPIGAAFVSARPVCLTSGTAPPTNAGDTYAPTVMPTVGKDVACRAAPRGQYAA